MKKMANKVAQHEKLLTAAIDFGTTFSGYAYAFKTDLDIDEPVVSTNKWQGGNTISHKAPTAVLFDSHQHLHSFGYQAEEKYSELCANEEHEDWYFFQRFKMLLHSGQTISKKMKIKEEGGKEMLAIDVFAGAIEFMKNHSLKQLKIRISDIVENDVHWVLTVPAIWNNQAKQFMREAAEKAGISHSQLQIALEPECASVCCQRMPTDRATQPDGSASLIAKSNSTFLVLDLGGGTADITVQKKQDNGTLTELYKASGGPWGGAKVDSEFLNLMYDIFGGANVGEKVMSTLKKTSMEDYIDLFREFEIKKRTARLEETGKIQIKLSVSLLETFKEVTNTALKDAASNSKYGDKIAVKADKLRIQSEVFCQLFKPSIDSIINHVCKLLKKIKIDIDYILMVGGFSASQLVQNAIRKAFSKIKIIIPPSPELSVLMGAVLFGHNPGIVSSRVSRFTYGLRGKAAFKAGIHPDSKKGTIDGRDWCSDIFFKLAEAGQTLKVGDTMHGQTFTPTEKDQKVMSVPIFVTSAKNPEYTTDNGCRYLGKIIVDMPDQTGGYQREVEIKFCFAGTELEVEALEKKTMKTFKTRVNFVE